MANEKVMVIGFGRTGKAALNFLLQQLPGEQISLYNDFPLASEEETKEYRRRGVSFLIGQEKFRRLAEAKLLIVSPGVDARTDRFLPFRERGVEIVSEIEYACRFITAKVIAVTGTNGKSTTVSLIHHLLLQGGKATILAGNIGVPLIGMLDAVKADTVLVLELSSFQLEEVARFSPHTGVLLNLTPDHLDRYPSLEEYGQAKLNLLRHLQPDGYAILNTDDPWLVSRVGFLARERILWFSLAREVGQGAFLKDDTVILRLGGVQYSISLRDNPLPGIHNLENILASFLAVWTVGLEISALAPGLASFRGLEHRMELVTTAGGVSFVNDSKATNVDAALKSILSYPGNLAVILGGKDKGSDYRQLEGPLRQRSAKVILIGQATERIAKDLSALRAKLVRARDMKEAVSLGYEAMRDKSGVVLLAPACASFDMFRNFEHRGEVFRQEALALKREIEHG